MDRFGEFINRLQVYKKGNGNKAAKIDLWEYESSLRCVIKEARYSRGEEKNWLCRHPKAVVIATTTAFHIHETSRKSVLTGLDSSYYLASYMLLVSCYKPVRT